MASTHGFSGGWVAGNKPEKDGIYWITLSYKVKVNNENFRKATLAQYFKRSNAWVNCLDLEEITNEDVLCYGVFVRVSPEMSSFLDKRPIEQPINNKHEEKKEYEDVL